MADVRVMKRGKVYQYQFEIAPTEIEGETLVAVQNDEEQTTEVSNKEWYILIKNTNKS